MVWPHFPRPLSSLLSDMTFSTGDHSFTRNPLVSDTITHHCLNQVIQIVAPIVSNVEDTKKQLQQHFPELSKLLFTRKEDPSLDSKLSQQTYFRIINAPIYLLVHRSFIEAYVLKGSVYVISECQHVDQQDCLAILPTGVMHVSLSAKSYHRLGVVGHESILNAKKSASGDRHVIRIDLKDPLITCRFEKQKYYMKIFNSFLKSGLIMNLMIRWIPDPDSFSDATVSAHSIRLFFDHMKGNPGGDGDGRSLSVDEANSMQIKTCIPNVRSFQNVHQYTPVSLINFKDILPGDDEGRSELLNDAQDWIGSQLCSLDTVIKDHSCLDVNSFGFDSNSCVTVSSVLCSEVYGFFTPDDVFNLLEEYDSKAGLISQEIPFIGVIVSGFENSPISWSYGERAEHGKDLSGENSYTILLTSKSHCIPKSLMTNIESGSGDERKQTQEVIRKTMIWRRADAFDFSIQRL